MPIKNGDTVVVQYVGTLADGSDFDRSGEGHPLSFRVGAGQMIPGFEKAVEGREKGEVFSVTIPAEEAYGPVHEEYRFTVDPSRFPSGIEPAVGQRLHLSSDQGELEAVVAAVEEDGVLLDANHPLAGQDLTFALTIVDVR